MTTRKRLVAGLIVLLAIILLPTVARASDLNTVASTIAGAPRHVICIPDNPDVAGWVDPSDPSVIALVSSYCSRIINNRGTVAEGVAFSTLTHEIAHSLGYWAEGDAECVSYRNAYAWESTLGLTGKARHNVWMGVYYNHTGKPTTGPLAAYRSVC